jgi:hypothetical protein
MFSRFPIMLALYSFAYMQGCGSSDNDGQTIEYKNQSVELVRDVWANGLSPSSTCDDGVTVCRNYGYSGIDNDGVMVTMAGCRPTNGLRGPSKDLFCQLYAEQTRQLTQDQLDFIKRAVVTADPEHLSHYYECLCNDSCSSDPQSLSLHITLDGVSKTITYSEGGPAVSRRFSALLEAVGKIGL